MKKTFIRTKNVKQFVSLMDELQKVPPNIPKMALVYGEHGLGKSQTIQWWADKNDSVYVRATQGMTSRWLLSEIAEELGEEAFYHSQETFTLIENNLRQNNKVIIVDEVDYLIDKSIIETLRDEVCLSKYYPRIYKPLVEAFPNYTNPKILSQPLFLSYIWFLYFEELLQYLL